MIKTSMKLFTVVGLALYIFGSTACGLMESASCCLHHEAGSPKPSCHSGHSMDSAGSPQANSGQAPASSDHERNSDPGLAGCCCSVFSDMPNAAENFNSVAGHVLSSFMPLAFLYPFDSDEILACSFLGPPGEALQRDFYLRVFPSHAPPLL